MIIKLSANTFVNPKYVIAVIGQAPIVGELGSEEEGNSEDLKIPAHVVIYTEGKTAPIGIKAKPDTVNEFSDAISCAIISQMDVPEDEIEKYSLA